MNFDKYGRSIFDVYKSAGVDLTIKMLDVFKYEDKVVGWFYSPNRALGGIAPSQGKLSDIEKMLVRIEHGIIS